VHLEDGDRQLKKILVYQNSQEIIRLQKEFAVLLTVRRVKRWQYFFEAVQQLLSHLALLGFD